MYKSDTWEAEGDRGTGQLMQIASRSLHCSNHSRNSQRGSKGEPVVLFVCGNAEDGTNAVTAMLVDRHSWRQGKKGPPKLRQKPREPRRTYIADHPAGKEARHVQLVHAENKGRAERRVSNVF